jgi:trk system potassium uptake protein TrkA
MYIIVAGSGTVGFHIASLLAEAKHEVTVIESSEEVLEGVRRQIDVKTIVGNAATPRVLREAEVNRANLVVAVTSNDETNMLICFLSKELGAVMTTARVRNPDYSGYFITAAKSTSAARKVIRPKTLGINLIINPEVEIADEIMGILSSLYPTPVESFADGRVQIREFRVDQSALTDRLLTDISFPQPCVVAAISRAGKTFVPGNGEVISNGDHVYLVAEREYMDDFGEMFAPPRHPVRSIAVLGAGHVGTLISEGLEKHGLSIKVIDNNPGRCQEIAARLERATVLQGDATDPDFLIEQGIPSADAFVAATESDEMNILCSLLAKHLGVPRTIVTASKPGFIPLAEAIGVDVAVSPLLQVASRITHFVLHGGAISAPFIGGKDLQAIEFVVSASANIVQQSIAGAGLPKEVSVGAVVRDDRVIIPPGDTMIHPGDHVIIVSPISAIPSVERFFK